MFGEIQLKRFISKKNYSHIWKNQNKLLRSSKIKRFKSLMSRKNNFLQIKTNFLHP